MDPFIFIILLFSTVLIATLSSWFIGLLLDANIDFGMDLAFRILFPVLAMGLCILRAIIKPK